MGGLANRPYLAENLGSDVAGKREAKAAVLAPRAE